MKWLKCLLALCVLVVSQLVVAGSSYAASDYDDVYETTPSLVAGGAPINNLPDCDNQDLSTSWSGILTDPDRWYATAINYSDTYISAFDLALENGSWAISNVSLEPANGGMQYAVSIIYSTDSQLQLQWYDDYAVVHGYGNVFQVSIIVDSWTGHYTCQPVVVPGGSGGHQYMQLSNTTAWGTHVAVRGFLFTGDRNLPDDYEGQIPPATYTPPAPVLHLGTGTADCLSLEPPAEMLIYQPGNNGSATLTDSIETGKVNYAYNFTDDPYSVAILCGTQWTASLPVSDTSVYWMCDRNGEYLKECELG